MRESRLPMSARNRPQNIARLPVGEARLAFAEDLPRTFAADLHIELAVDEAYRARPQGEDVVLADVVEIAAALEELHDLAVDAVEIESAAQTPPSFGFECQHLRARDVDEVDA